MSGTPAHKDAGMANPEPERWAHMIETMEEIKPGDVLLFGADDSAMDTVILTLSHSYVGHAALCVAQSQFSDETRYGATRRGFRIELEEGKGDNKPSTGEDEEYHSVVYVRRPKAADKIDKIVAASESLLGSPYDWPALYIVAVVSALEQLIPNETSLGAWAFKTAVRAVAQLVINISHTGAQQEPMICSQFVVRCFNDAECDLELKAAPADIRPYKDRLMELIHLIPTILAAIKEAIDAQKQGDGDQPQKKRAKLSKPAPFRLPKHPATKTADEIVQELVQTLELKHSRSVASGINDRDHTAKILSLCVALLDVGDASQSLDLTKEDHKKLQSLVDLAGTQVGNALDSAMKERAKKDAGKASVFIYPGDLMSNCGGLTDVGKVKIAYPKVPPQPKNKEQCSTHGKGGQ